jgi:hypothetical protein
LDPSIPPFRLQFRQPMGNKNHVGDNQLDRGGDMSTPDARLSAAERAALADLEAAAAADDPSLADRLKGSAASRARPALLTARFVVLHLWSAVLRTGYWGFAMVAVGLFCAIAGITSGLALSIFGALLCAVGLRVLAAMVDGRGRDRRPPA